MRRLTAALGAGYLVALALLVFTPIAPQLGALTVRLYVWWNYSLGLPGRPSPETFGFLLNVVMFVPLGLLVVLVVRRSWVTAVLGAVALSATIELVQALPWLHRYASVQDVISNGLGGLVGGLIGAGLQRRATRRAQEDRPFS